MKNLLLKLIGCAFLLLLFSCKSAYNKGVTDTKEFRPRNPPSVRIKQEYDKVAKRAKRGQKSLKGKQGEALDKALIKQKNKKLKRDKRYLKKRKRMARKK